MTLIGRVRPWLLASLLGLAGGAHADNAAATTAWANGSALFELQDKAGTCTLRVQAQNGPVKLLPTALPWPCQFHLDKQGQVRNVAAGRAKVVLIESSQRLTTRDCDTRIQGLRVAAGQAHLSPHHDRLASCPPFQWDAFVFSALF